MLYTSNAIFMVAIILHFYCISKGTIDNFTQFIFKVADGIGKCFTPLFVYFIVMLAFLEKYRVSEKNQISIFGTIKSILPTVLLLTFVWLLVICLWYLIGIPIGVGTMSTL